MEKNEHSTASLAQPIESSSGAHAIRVSQNQSVKKAVSKKETSQYAGFWWRLAAFQFDFILVTLIVTLSISVVATLYGAATDTKCPAWVSYGLLAVIPWMYFSIFESSQWKGGPGKRFFGLRVSDTSGKQIGFRAGSIRYVVRPLAALLFFAGYLMIFWSRKSQTLHDRMARTLVIRRIGQSQAERLSLILPMKVMETCKRHAVALVASWTIIISIAILIGLLYLMAPTLKMVKARHEFENNIVAIQSIKDYVGIYVTTKGRYPDAIPREVTDTLKLSSDVSLTYFPRFGYIDIAFYGSPYLTGRTASFAPIRRENQILWSCSAPGINAEVLPATCTRIQ
jgi:uncharacterized RDD family membrane protein YckC/type II secretory pathway pseudopilin PulG